MNKPYRISGLPGADPDPTQAAAAVIWTHSGVSPPVPRGLDSLTFIIDGAF